MSKPDGDENRFHFQPTPSETTKKPLFVKIETPTLNLETLRLEGSNWFDEEQNFTDEMLEKAKKGATFNQLDRQIAEWDYRRPVRIPFSGGWAIRPFWRDKRQAPPLPWDK